MELTVTIPESVAAILIHYARIGHAVPPREDSHVHVIEAFENECVTAKGAPLSLIARELPPPAPDLKWEGTN